mmetsp:Transcript_1754/g.3154  ORF Transcript_1754/g.3154 Transcript_1754/m.3154 type:complete len:91 (-) Transcript_1754:118-390(-)
MGDVEGEAQASRAEDPVGKPAVIKDIDDEIAALITKARQRLEGVTTTMDDNGEKLKKLQKGFSDLKRQQAHVAREQQQVIGSLQNGLTTT